MNLGRSSFVWHKSGTKTRETHGRSVDSGAGEGNRTIVTGIVV